MESFGELLRTKRENARMTMGALAKRLGISVSYLSDVERGRRNPLGKAQIIRVAGLLDISVDELLEAAAATRGAFELEATTVSEKGREAGAALMRGWSDLTDEEFAAIQAIVSGGTK